MKKLNQLKSKLLVAAAVALALPAVALGGTTSAIGEGQIERGDIYYSRNVTTGSAFGDPTAANKCDTLQYKVRMHNPGASPVTNVNIRVNLPAGASTQNVSTATITAENASPATVSDTATVNLSSSQKISYISGSTQLLNASNAVIGDLPDGITGGGVNVGSVGVSINEIRFVQFQAKVDCPTPPTPCVDNPATPEDECNPCKDNPSTPQDECNPKSPEYPGGSNYPTGSEGVEELANSGAGSAAGIITAAVIAGIIAFRVYLGRRFANN